VELVTVGVGAADEDAGSVCGAVVAARIVGDDFSGDGVPAGDASAGVGELAEEGWFAGDAGGEAGAGAED
jgi:hypothetical protein